MKNNRSNKNLVTLILFMFSAMLINAQSKEELKQQIVDALNDGADYASNILIDEEGKSKCDYNITEGKWYPYEPAWHTGQVIYGLIDAYGITKNELHKNTAIRAGDWWVSLQIKDNTNLNGMLYAVHADYVKENIVFATVSDGTHGLFKLSELTGDKKYSTVATSAGAWMLEHMYLPVHGMFYDAVDSDNGKVLKDKSPFWPGLENQTIHHVARPNNEGSLYKDMYEFTKNEKYKEVFIALCESLLEKQGEEGLWMDYMPNNREVGNFHPRFNLWYAESLLEGYDLTGDRRYLEGAKKTLVYYQKFQRPDGTFFYKNYYNGKKSNRNSICGSAVSFAGLLWLRMEKYGEGKEFRDNIELSIKWILKNRFSPNHPDKNLAGSFLNTRTRRKHDKVWLVNRDVGTSFGLRFLADYYNYNYGSK